MRSPMPRRSARRTCVCGCSPATAAQFPRSRSAPSASRSARLCSRTAAAPFTPPAVSRSIAGKARNACSYASSTSPWMTRRRGCELPHRIFYGWYVVGAIGVVLTPPWGWGFYNLWVLLDAFVRKRGFPGALASGAPPFYFVGGGIGGVAAGWLIDRFDSRAIVIVSAFLNALLFGCLRVLSTPLQLYLFHLSFGLCYGCGGIIPNMQILARWFEARRSLAVSIASTGLLGMM